MRDLRWSKDYKPGQFDAIREKMKGNAKRAKFARYAVLFLFGILLPFAIFATFLFANKTFALDTETWLTGVESNAVQEKTGWSLIDGMSGGGMGAGYGGWWLKRSEGACVGITAEGWPGAGSPAYVKVNPNGACPDFWETNGWGQNTGAPLYGNSWPKVDFSARTTDLWGGFLDVVVHFYKPTQAVNVDFRFVMRKDGSWYNVRSMNEFISFEDGFLTLRVTDGSDFRKYLLGNIDHVWVDQGTTSFPASWPWIATVPQMIVTANATPERLDKPTFFFRGSDDKSYWYQPAVWMLFNLTDGTYTTNSGLSLACDFVPLCDPSNNDDSLVPSGMVGYTPIGIREMAQDNWIVFHNSSTGTVAQFQDGYVPGLFTEEAGNLRGFVGYSNPVAYFVRKDGSFATVDMHCLFPGYDLCRQYNGGWYACVNSLWQLPPGKTEAQSACVVGISATPWDFEQSNPGENNTGSTNTGGVNCSGSGCISQGTGSGAVSGLKGFFDYVLDWDADGDGQVSITEALAGVPRSIGRFFGGIIDRLSEAWSQSWSIIEQTLKMTQPTGSGSKTFWFSLIDTASAESGQINPMVQAVKDQAHNVATGDNVFARMVDFMYWGIILTLVLVAVYLFATLRRG